MKHEGINSTRLAEMLGIQASGISHIMNGRNKPSYDFLLKLLQRFPQLNPDWLILDKGPMYRDEVKKNASSVNSSQQTTASTSGMTIVSDTNNRGATGIHEGANRGADLFADPGRKYDPVQQPGHYERDDEDIIPTGGGGTGGMRNFARTTNNHYDPAKRAASDVATYPAGTTAHNIPFQSSDGFLPSSSIERIVVFYKDKTFSEYQPQ